ncbi:MAG: response regulator [Deltaproteobacteria bacterium]|nr:response regulator [Deltaproteobacteria bacterium]
MLNPKEHIILFVDDGENILSSLYRLFRKEGYNMLKANNARDGLALFGKNKISLVISDHRMPEMEGVDFLAKVKEISPDTIRIMLTGYANMDATVSAINVSGVHRYITKPWDDNALKLTVRDLIEQCELKKENARLFELTEKQNKELKELNESLERKVEDRTRQLRESFFAFIRICVDLMELYDPHLSGHSKRVAKLSREIAVKMGLDSREIEFIESAALLHDIGIIGVPKEILKKDEDSMSDVEISLFRQHPIAGQDAIGELPDLKQIGLIIRSHHEGWSGRGYPDRLRGEEIPVGSRIISAANRFDNIFRLHDKKTAVIELKKERGIDLDPEAVNHLIEIVEGKKDDEESVQEVPFSMIKEGMILAKDIYTNGKKLLLPKGNTLTGIMVERLKNFHRIDPIVDWVYILRDK